MLSVFNEGNKGRNFRWGWDWFILFWLDEGFLKLFVGVKMLCF